MHRRLKDLEDEENENTEDSSFEDDVVTSGDIEHCPECGSANIAEYEHEGEIVCEDCGLVITDNLIDYGPEWRSFNDETTSNKRRTGPPRTELRHDKGTTSTIDWKNQDARGNAISSNKQQQMHRLRRLDKHAKRNSGERRIAYANGEIKRMGSSLGAPKNIQKTAASLYRQAHDNDLIPGRSIEAIASACLYIALRTHNKPRSLDEITNVSRVDRKPIQSAYQYLTTELSISLPPIDPSEYIQRFAAKLSLPQPVIRVAEKLLDDLNDTHHTSGNHPGVLAASALYAAGLIDGNLVTQKAMTNASNVTEVSIRNNYPMFLTETNFVSITEDEIKEANTPKDVSKQIHDEPETVSYLSHTTKRNTNNGTTENTDSDTNNENNNGNGNGNGYTCNLCEAKFDTETKLEEHREETHSTIETPFPDSQHNFKCGICPYTAETYHALRVHFGRAHPHYDEKTTQQLTYAVDPAEHEPYSPTPTITGTNYTCEYCDNTYETLDLLHDHQNETHDGNRNANDNVLEFYTTIHHRSPQYACPECDTTTITPHDLETHFETEHPDDDPQPTQTYREELTCSDFVNTICTHTPIPESAPFDTNGHTIQEKTELVHRVCEAFKETKIDFHPLVISLTAVVIGVGGLQPTSTTTTPSFSEAVANAAYATYNYSIDTIGQTLNRPTVYTAFATDDPDVDLFIAYQNVLEWVIESAPHNE